MTVRELIGQLEPYTGEGIRQVLAESGEHIMGIYSDDTYIILITSEIDDSLSVDGLITRLDQLDQSDQEKEVVTDSMEDICCVAYVCIADPVLYLKYHI